jgi:hypothetical protein
MTQDVKTQIAWLRGMDKEDGLVLLGFILAKFLYKIYSCNAVTLHHCRLYTILSPLVYINYLTEYKKFLILNIFNFK